MSSYDVIIIGGGIGGLTCGAFLAKHGKKVLIAEQHHKPGGAVTSFSRKGFTFDVPSVVGGVGKEFIVGRILWELGVYDKLEFIRLDKLFHLIYPEMAVECHADTDRYRAELECLFPAERRGLDRYFFLMRTVMEEMKRSYYAPGPIRSLMYPLRYPHLSKYAGKQFSTLMDELFTDSRLKIVLSGGWQYLGLPPDRLSALYMMIMYQSYLGEGTYFPKGGFQNLSDVIADVFRGQGGELRLGAPVGRISLQGNRATGIVLDDGEHIAGRTIVSNADVLRTFRDLVGMDALPQRFRGRLARIEMSGSGLVVSVGVRMPVPETFNCGTVIYHPSWEATRTHWEEYDRQDIESDLKRKILSIDVRSLADPGLAPAGCHAVRLIDVPVPYWYRNRWMEGDRRAYLELKDQMRDHLLMAAEQILPGLSRHVMITDVSTPLTFERYLRSTDGAWYDAACIPEQIGLARMPFVTPVKGLYLTGAKTFPGHGILVSMQSGVCTADILLGKRLLDGKFCFQD